MDDFGTGYSSLSYLTQLPLDQLKVDQSFVRNIGIKSTDAVIVQTIVGMANNLNMEAIAEGVETQAQRDFLEKEGCLRYQGYLFGKRIYNVTDYAPTFPDPTDQSLFINHNTGDGADVPMNPTLRRSANVKVAYSD